MKATFESTTKIVRMEEGGGGALEVRVWEGHTEHGVPCHAYIARVAVLTGLDPSEFDHDLERAHAEPSGALAVLPDALTLTPRATDMERRLRDAFEEGYAARGAERPLEHAWANSESRMSC